MTLQNPQPRLPFSFRLPSYRVALPLLGIGGAAGLFALARGHLPVPVLWGLVILLLLAGAAGPLIAYWRQRQAATPQTHNPGTNDNGRAAAVQQGQRQSLAEARQRLQSGHDGGKAALALPWFYLVGDTPLALNLLRSAAATAPLPPPNPVAQPDTPWHFWFLRDSVVVQLTEAASPDDAVTRTAWREMLTMGRTLRPGLAANGIIVILPIRLLMDPAGAAARQACQQRLRGLIHGLQQGLGAALPLHVLLTGFEELPGAADLLKHMPPEACSQALGHVYSDAEGHDVAAETARFTATLERFFHQLRLGQLEILDAPPQAAMEREAAFLFGETVTQFQPALTSFLVDLVAPAALQHPVRLRSLYLVGGNHPASFSQDALARLIPRDGALGRALTPVRRGRQRLALAGTAALVLLSAATLFWLLYSSPKLDRAADDVVHICNDQGQQGAVRSLTACGEALLDFDRAVAGAGWIGWYRPVMGLRDLRQSWAAAWADSVGRNLLGGLEQELDRRDSRRFGLAVSLAQGAALVDMCDQQGQACAHLAEEQRNLGQRLSSLGTPKQLLRLHGAHIAWLDHERRTQEREEFSQLSRRLWRSNPPNVTDMLVWLNDRAPPLSLSQFWGAAGTMPSQMLEGAYTAAGWEKELRPALALLVAHGFAPADEVESLRRSFMAQRQTGWSRFIAQFGSGITLRAGEPQAVKALLATKDENPFDRLVRELEASVLATTPQAELRPWAATLQPFLKGDWHKAMSLLREATEQLAADPTGLTGYKLAAEAMQTRGSAGARSAAALLQAEEILAKARRELPVGNDTTEDKAAMELLRVGPRTVLLLALADAGRHIDQEWGRQVRSQALQLPRSQRQQFLAGSNGAVAMFSDSVLAPFRESGSGVPASLFDLKLPLSAEFTDLANRLRQPGVRESGNLAGQLVINNISQIGSMAEGPQGTQLVADCPRQPAAVRSGGSLAERRAPLYWDAATCTSLKLTISVPIAADPSGASLLVREWRGTNMLLDAAALLKGGRLRLKLADFDHSLTAEAQQTLSGGEISPIVSVDAAIQLINGFDPTGGGPDDLPASIMQPLL